jgi:uncharacterized coiled-coil protein SlyX
MWDRVIGELVHGVLRRLERLEVRMSRTDDAIAQITDAVNKVATDVATLQAEVADSGDDATAAKLQPIVDQLNALDALTPDPVEVPPVS